MNISEKVAYLQGLAKGVEINTETGEGKVLNEVINVLSDMSHCLSGLEFGMDILADQLDELNEDLDYLYDEEEDTHKHHEHHGEHGHGCRCGHAHGEEDLFENLYEGDLYKVKCLGCSEEIILTEENLDEGEIDCPGCGENLEFDFSGPLEDENDEAIKF